jgi:hypothetical protein
MDEGYEMFLTKRSSEIATKENLEKVPDRIFSIAVPTTMQTKFQPWHGITKLWISG